MCIPSLTTRLISLIKNIWALKLDLIWNHFPKSDINVINGRYLGKSTEFECIRVIIKQ
jgi:hypothetical protein